MMKKLSAVLLIVVVISLVGSATLAATPHWVTWVESEDDYTTEINDAILAAMEDGGVVVFEAGRTYPCDWVRLYPGMRGDRQFMPAGIEGNGATIRARVDTASPSLFYMWHPQESGNQDFFIRDLTIDANQESEYALRVWGGNDFIIENVSAVRAKKVGVYLQGSTPGYELYDVTLRNVLGRHNAQHGIRILGSSTEVNPVVRDIKMENCYAHYNAWDGIFIERARVNLVGFGAEYNGGFGMRVGSPNGPVPAVSIIGGYTEHNHQLSYQDPTVFYEAAASIKQTLAPSGVVSTATHGPDESIYLSWDSAGSHVSHATILGGRFIGGFKYGPLTDSIIHSHNHLAVGFDDHVPLVAYTTDYESPAIDTTNSQNPAYTGVAESFLGRPMPPHC